MRSYDTADAETLLCHFGEHEKLHGAVVPPIFHNSLFSFNTVAEFAESVTAPSSGPPYVYSRVSNPTVNVAEQKIARLEGTEGCRVFSSGMAAISSAVMSCVQAGSHVVAVDTSYGPLQQFLNEYLTKFGITATFVEGSDPEELLAAIRPETTMVYLESPSSLIFRLQDFETITRYCREGGITTITDNTYSTPLYQQPAAMGVDLIVHSATKYLGGHSDVTAGVVCGSAERIAQLTKDEVSLFGSLIAPFPAWLLTRGLRTLGVRIRRHEETGNEIAAWLEKHPSVDHVNHVSLASNPQRELYQKQMRGSTGLFSFVPKQQDREKVIAFVEALDIFQIGVSWGGFESLSVPIEVTPLHYGEPTWLIRLFVGLESPKDLMADLQNAFAVSGL